MPRPALLHPAARLSAFYAAAFLVTGVQLPFWPVWLTARGLDAREIGIVFAAAIWVKVAATPAIGALADNFGRRRVMGLLAATALAAYIASVVRYRVLAAAVDQSHRADRAIGADAAWR